MWEKIVLNLISNAIKFTFEGTIEVSLRATDGAVVLRVATPASASPPRISRTFSIASSASRARARGPTKAPASGSPSSRSW